MEAVTTKRKNRSSLSSSLKTEVSRKAVLEVSQKAVLGRNLLVDREVNPMADRKVAVGALEDYVLVSADRYRLR